MGNWICAPCSPDGDPNLNFLFVCSKNRLRSPTAEAVFCNYPGVDAVAAGTSKDSETPLSGKRLVVLGIPDRFEFMQSELVALLKEKVERYCPGS